MNLEPQQFYNSVEKALEKSEFAPLYFFFGEESYLINQALNYLKVCALHGGAADFNYTSYFSTDVDMATVKDEVETLPMMAPRRVVVLKEVQDLTDREWQELEGLFTQPVQSSVFILVGGKVDKRKKFFRILSEAATSVEFKKPFENQIPGWIRHICRAHKLSISDDAVQLLHRLVGNQLSEIESELLKLQQYLGERNTIEMEDVAQCVSRTREESVFALTAAIARGDRAESLSCLVHLLDQGQNEIGIVQMVARHIRILLMIKHGQELDLAGHRLASHAQVPNYYLREYTDQARLWSIKKLEAILLILADTDRALKSSPLSSHIWLENLILRTCNLQQAPVVNVSGGLAQAQEKARF